MKENMDTLIKIWSSHCNWIQQSLLRWSAMLSVSDDGGRESLQNARNSLYNDKVDCLGRLHYTLISFLSTEQVIPSVSYIVKIIKQLRQMH